MYGTYREVTVACACILHGGENVGGRLDAGGRAYACRGLHAACVQNGTASKELDGRCIHEPVCACTDMLPKVLQADLGGARTLDPGACTPKLWLHAGGCIWVHAGGCLQRPVHTACMLRSRPHRSACRCIQTAKNYMQAGARKGFGRTVDTGARACSKAAFCMQSRACEGGACMRTRAPACTSM
jgi:hypothetical protein